MGAKWCTAETVNMKHVRCNEYVERDHESYNELTGGHAVVYKTLVLTVKTILAVCQGLFALIAIPMTVMSLWCLLKVDNVTALAVAMLGDCQR